MPVKHSVALTTKVSSRKNFANFHIKKRSQKLWNSWRELLPHYSTSVSSLKFSSSPLSLFVLYCFDYSDLRRVVNILLSPVNNLFPSFYSRDFFLFFCFRRPVSYFIRHCNLITVIFILHTGTRVPPSFLWPLSITLASNVHLSINMHKAVGLVTRKYFLLLIVRANLASAIWFQQRTNWFMHCLPVYVSLHVENWMVHNYVITLFGTSYVSHWW